MACGADMENMTTMNVNKHNTHYIMSNSMFHACRRSIPRGRRMVQMGYMKMHGVAWGDAHLIFPIFLMHAHIQHGTACYHLARHYEMQNYTIATLFGDNR